MRTNRSLAVVGMWVASMAGLAAAPSTQPATRPYPLKTCVVSGDALGGDMGDPVIYKYKGREIRFCCKNCVKDFEKDPAKYLKKLDDAEKATSRPSEGR